MRLFLLFYGQYRPSTAQFKADKGRNPQRPRAERFKGPPRGRFNKNFKDKEGDKSRDDDKKDG